MKIKVFYIFRKILKDLCFFTEQTFSINFTKRMILLNNRYFREKKNEIDGKLTIILNKLGRSITVNKRKLSVYSSF